MCLTMSIVFLREPKDGLNPWESLAFFVRLCGKMSNADLDAFQEAIKLDCVIAMGLTILYNEFVERN